jgi:hypothetical protein
MKMKRKSMVLTTVLVLLGICCNRLWAGPTTAQQAQKAVAGWLRADPQPLGSALGQQVSRVETFTDQAGDPLYYIVYLEPSGFVIVPADDLVEPIIGFSSEGTYDPSPKNPLGVLVTQDVKGRIAAVRDTQSLQASGAAQSALAAQAKWEQLESWAEGVGILGLESISDIRRAPLVKSKWSQTTCCEPPEDTGLACYNYYTPPFPTEGDEFGYSVAIDGDVAVVGAPEDDDNGDNSGSAYVFRYEDSAWVLEQKLVSPDVSASGDNFGRSVAVSGDVIVVGAPLDTIDTYTGCGSAFVFRFDPAQSEWKPDGAKLTGLQQDDHHFGWSVAADGQFAVVGAPGTASGRAVYFFGHDGSNWILQTRRMKTPSPGWGWSVDLDGLLAANGAPFNGEGEAYITRGDGSWWSGEAPLTCGGCDAGAGFGYSVAVVSDHEGSDWAFIAAPWDDGIKGSDAGSVFVFDNRFGWNESGPPLIASDGHSDDHFGWSVGASGGTILVGAPDHNTASGVDVGAVYVFAYDLLSLPPFAPQAKLIASDGQANSDFGWSVAISGNAALVGEPYRNDNCTDSGLAYVFRHGADWVQEQQLPHGDPCNYPCGCVATAMAQVMRYHEHPDSETGIGVNQCRIKVDDTWYDVWTRGGDGVGGPYDWIAMDLVPDSGTPEANRQGIGALCYDAGATVGMRYTQKESEADLQQVNGALVNTFDYDNAIYNSQEWEGDIPKESDLFRMINPNLDACSPVILGISNDNPEPNDPCAHAVVADGYGYHLSQMYHHLNMGWAGYGDLWYALPIVDPDPDFDAIDGCVYNIFPVGMGEIISGRVTDSDGVPIKGAQVTAEGPGGPYDVETDSSGIYAFVAVASNSEYTISVSVPGMYYIFVAQLVLTGESIDDPTNACGNVWGVDFHDLMFLYVDDDAPGDPMHGDPTDSDPLEDGTAAHPFDSIQEAIDATPGTTVIVLEGTYRGLGNRDIDYGGKGVVVRSVDPCDPDIVRATIVDCEGSGRGFYFHSGEGPGCLLSGLTIKNGYTLFDGGGIYCCNNSDPTVARCLIIGNVSVFGGGIACDNSNPTIVNCRFSGNSADYGGGISCWTSDPTVVNCVINSNACDSGGGISCWTSSPELTNCAFTANRAVNAGGGMWCYDDSYPDLFNCTFSGNSAVVGGAIQSETYSNPELYNCILWADTATDGPEIAIIGTELRSYVGVYYSDVEGGEAAVYLAGDAHLYWGDGSIDADPGFVKISVPGMIAYWTLDEPSGATAFDSVNGNDGTLVNGPVWTTGQVNGALSFDGTDDYVSTPLYPPMGNSPRTVTLWAKTSSAQHMIATGYGSRDYGGSFRTSLNWTCPGVTADISFGAITYTATVDDGEWHFYSWVVPDGAYYLYDVDVYMDGVLLTTEGCQVDRNRPINTRAVYAFTIGAFAGESHFNGSLDEVAVFGRALTQAEIQQCYQKGLAGQSLVDYRLLSGSPCIDAGDNHCVPPAVMTDLDEQPRFVDDPFTSDTGIGTPPIVDMGAYEFYYMGTCWDPAECAGQPDGDATCDGNVNLADLFALKAHFGKSAPWTPPECCADFDQSGAINLADLFALKAGFGSGPYSPSTTNQSCP